MEKLLSALNVLEQYFFDGKVRRTWKGILEKSPVKKMCSAEKGTVK